jgi:hypothetical protein
MARAAFLALLATALIGCHKDTPSKSTDSSAMPSNTMPAASPAPPQNSAAFLDALLKLDADLDAEVTHDKFTSDLSDAKLEQAKQPALIGPPIEGSARNLEAQAMFDFSEYGRLWSLLNDPDVGSGGNPQMAELLQKQMDGYRHSASTNLAKARTAALNPTTAPG